MTRLHNSVTRGLRHGTARRSKELFVGDWCAAYSSSVCRRMHMQFHTVHRRVWTDMYVLFVCSDK